MKVGDSFTYYDFFYDKTRRGLVVSTTEGLVGWVQYDDMIASDRITYTAREKAEFSFDLEGKHEEQEQQKPEI